MAGRYSQGWPSHQGDRFVQELLAAHAESERIDFVLAGHTHDYERLTMEYGGQTTHHMVLGGAGGGLEKPESAAAPVMDRLIKQHHFGRFEVDGPTLWFTARNLEGEVIDRFRYSADGGLVELPLESDKNL